MNNHLPVETRHKWRPLFNSRLHGESFSKVSAAIVHKGPTLLVVTEKVSSSVNPSLSSQITLSWVYTQRMGTAVKLIRCMLFHSIVCGISMATKNHNVHIFFQNGFKFGGFASESWRVGPKFYGPDSCFLFSLGPKMYTYETTRFNANYQYMNIKQKTMPNGIGMGGQLDFFGLWLDSEYGHGRCAPSCSSYASPQLSKEECFQYTHLEVWGVGEEPVLGKLELILVK